MLRRFTRRTMLGAACLLTLLPGLASASPATDFVSSFGGDLAHVLNSSEPVSQKREEILPLLRKNVDIQGIGRYVLGRYWRVATPAQRTRYLTLFEDVLLYAVTVRMGSYQQVSLKILGEVPSPAGTKVTVSVERPRQPSIILTTVVSGNPPKVVDLYGEGASMRMTQRSDYTAFLSRHGGQVQTLIDALSNQVARNRNVSSN
ncbi:ABC transporter substrate-binding protein [Saccharibacter sp. 17.LH.SD]|nr:ABC transporter substrate-binding protein [Saccharibacter sp. 17.LH.SD]